MHGGSGARLDLGWVTFQVASRPGSPGGNSAWRRLCMVGRLPLTGQESTTFSTDVKVVNVLATVHAKSGQIVRDLNKDDFSITENGRPQTIRYFSRETDLPLTLGLMVDTSYSQRRLMDAERGASTRFLDQVLREDKDKVFLLQFDTSVQIKAELTSSWRKLVDALAYVDTASRRELQMSGGGTVLYDAIVRAVARHHEETEQPQGADRAHRWRGRGQRGDGGGRGGGGGARGHAGVFDRVLRSRRL